MEAAVALVGSHAFVRAACVRMSVECAHTFACLHFSSNGSKQEQETREWGKLFLFGCKWDSSFLTLLDLPEKSKQALSILLYSKVPTDARYMQWGRWLTKNLEFKLKNRFLDANKKEATTWIHSTYNIHTFAAVETGWTRATESSRLVRSIQSTWLTQPNQKSFLFLVDIIKKVISDSKLKIKLREETITFKQQNHFRIFVRYNS